MFRKIRNMILLRGFDRSALAEVKPQIMEENRKYEVIWSIVHILFWTYCLIMSTRDPYYRHCREIYAVSLVISTVTLTLSLLAAPKYPQIIKAIAIILNEVLLLAGIMIARELAPRTIVVFAAVLIVPVSFIADSISIILILAINVIVFTQLGPSRMDAETYQWVLSNLCIFSLLGMMIGHFVNRARFERFIFSNSSAKLAEIQARYARRDQLTDLQNRRAYAETIDKLSDKMPDACSVVIIDINGLKKMNDTCGHNAGDELIIGTANCLRRSFEGTDTIYRIGGDEFCVIIFEKDYDIGKALNRLKELSAQWKGKFVQGISISVGVASSEEFADIESLIKAADKRMFESKRNYYESSGRDRRRKRTE